MKKLNLLLGLMLLWSSALFGAVVPLNTAKNVGYHYLIQNGGTLTSANELKLLYTTSAATGDLYVFGNDHCFVIVSGDDAVVPVLAYSNSNTFKADHMPAGLINTLQGYSRQIDYVVSNRIAATPAITAQWQDLKLSRATGAAAKTTAVSPLLSTTWDQFPYYNALCPADAAAGPFGGHVVSGCVATAMSQVMKFWSWPATGIGIHSYSTSSYGTLSANFGATTYNWSAMPNSVSAPNTEVARLMFHAGVSVDMQYTASESGAYVTEMASPITNCAEYALKTYFNYKPTLHGEARSDYSDVTWISMLQAELNAGRPIICDGSGTAGGHCFIYDGYDASNKFHVNWGWSGASDGYYLIDALNPPALGAGGGGGGFNSDQHAILGIQPNGSTVVSSSIVMASNVSVSVSSIFYTQPFAVTARVKNTGTTAFAGSYAAMVFDATTGLLVDSVQVLAGSLAPGATSTLLTFSTAGSLSMVPGDYNISIYSKTSSSSWTLVGDGSYTNMGMINVYNHNYIQCASLMTPSPSPMVQGSPASVSLNLQNDDIYDFSGSFEVALYNTDGTYNSTIETLTGMSLPALSVYTVPLTFSTSSVTAAPGTYLLVAWFNNGVDNYLCGADYFENPIYVTVVAPPPPPDIYEVNDAVGSAYTLPLTWTGNTSSKITTGSNFHVVTDEDYYKIVLPAGYNYTISARLNDILSADDGGTYTVDGSWNYSTNNGSTWSATYNDVMTGTINLTGGTGGTVIFHVSPHFAGDIGTYVLKLGSIIRTPVSSAIPNVVLEKATVYPNPATDHITVDLAGTNAVAISATLTDVQGRVVYTGNADNETTFMVPTQSLSAGLYIINVVTNAGVLTRKITISTK